jgi:hypothetical protein
MLTPEAMISAAQSSVQAPESIHDLGAQIMESDAAPGTRICGGGHPNQQMLVPDYGNRPNLWPHISGEVME